MTPVRLLTLRHGYMPCTMYAGMVGTLKELQELLSRGLGCELYHIAGNINSSVVLFQRAKEVYWW